MGIIDILMPFSAVKRLEAALLGLVVGDISCKPPRAYAARFAGFARHTFVAAATASSTATTAALSTAATLSTPAAATNGAAAAAYAKAWLDRPGASAIWPFSVWHRARRWRAGPSSGLLMRSGGFEFGKKDFVLALWGGGWGGWALLACGVAASTTAAFLLRGRVPRLR